MRTATEIADAEGLPALSMRRIATELDIPTMSLYRQIRGKEQLLLLMADAAFAAHRLPHVSARMASPTGVALPAPVGDLSTASLAGPGHLTDPPADGTARRRAHRMALRALSGHGLDQHTQLHLVAALANHVRGTAVSLEREAEAEQDTGLTDDEWMTAQPTC
ncbi:TetR family transcriptional regulator [Micromonospora sp. M12]